MLCLAALAACLAVAPARAVDRELWVAPQDVGRQDPPKDALRSLDMRCIAGRADLTACLMKDLYYDLMDGTFILFGRDIDVRASGGDTDADIERRFDERTAFLEEVQRKGGFSFKWSAAAPPPATSTCRVAMPVHLRQEWPLAVPELGNLLRDNFQPLVHIALKFGLSAAHFAWVSWPRASGPGTESLSPMQEKYAHWLSIHQSYKWDGLVKACRDGNLGITGGTPGETEPVQFMRLEHALVSGASADWTADARNTKACRTARFREQRTLAYTLAGIKHVPAHQPKRAVLSVIWKGPSERQRLFIPQDVLDLIDNRFPDIDIEMHDVVRESADAQMAWLARTSILLTNVGSASHRLIYLPDGAQVIYVGAMTQPMPGTDGADHRIIGEAFNDWTDCWQFLDHLEFFRYRIASPSNVSFSEDEPPFDPAGSLSRNEFEAQRIRNANVHLADVQTIRLLGLAMTNLFRQRVGVQL